tara:strand:- start:380 stop:532 length:153 start_codon:yes stop_codon:yes gene_type:complete
MSEDYEYECEECGFIASEEGHVCHKYEPTGSQSSMERWKEYYHKPVEDFW